METEGDTEGDAAEDLLAEDADMRSGRSGRDAAVVRWG